MKQARVFISGFVQGIGFRQFVRYKARKLGVTGFVKNLPDGRVEVIFQSSASSDQEAKEKIDQMILICKKGPFLAEVEDVQVMWEEGEKEYWDFKVSSSL